MIKLFEKGFNYSQDGPGNRLVYHLQGCNMHCPWCSNPEGMSCTQGSMTKTVEELVQEIMSCRPMFFDGGGVTFTGGEATLQMNELLELMRHLCREQIHIAIETNGTSSELTKLLPYIDYWIIDYKHPDSKQLENITGGCGKRIAQNIHAISKKKKVHIRIPMIHGFNDDRDSLEGFLSFFLELQMKKAQFDVELLAYHEYGREKWKKSGKTYTITDGFVTKGTLQTFENCFREHGISVIHT